MKPEDFRADAKRPLTGEEYLKSLQDGREIYIYGERVKDVTTHPASVMPRPPSLSCTMRCTNRRCRIPCAGAPIPAAAATPINSSAWRKAPTICASSATPSPNGRA
ncbi:4-hydroxyphenylacetate 3-monooxygenase [Klebsiella pneumoniae]|uniref:4-hydroxyphenylacetate 3-monooxygenase n=1 Tax=Klebsiella pneumoniae TaxID=573 RepID=A0A2X3D3E8_KLEPN|nr:4-hydroxyphenylacetate 3-monooxygenase [Klebsiella pneumoniae]